ncbi:MAG: hypothetical protein ACF8PN_06305 [Phycisphaerales bacterium]
MHGSWHVSPVDVMDRADLARLVSGWPEEWREEFEERAAIMEFLALNPVVPAEREAVKDVVRRARIVGNPLPMPRRHPAG